MQVGIVGDDPRAVGLAGEELGHTGNTAMLESASALRRSASLAAIMIGGKVAAEKLF